MSEHMNQILDIPSVLLKKRYNACKCLRLYNCVKMCLYMALYSVVNGPERSSRFYVFLQ